MLVLTKASIAGAHQILGTFISRRLRLQGLFINAISNTLGTGEYITYVCANRNFVTGLSVRVRFGHFQLYLNHIVINFCRNRRRNELHIALRH